MSNLTGIDAKNYENVGNRAHLTDTSKTRERQKNDALEGVKQELRKEGHTGALTEPDGLVRAKPFIYKDFWVEVFGRVEYENPVDIYGVQRWIGTAEGKCVTKGQVGKITFDVETQMPHGFETPREAVQHLIKLIDIFRKTK